MVLMFGMDRILFLLAAALIPPLVLMGVVYRMDRLDREPTSLLMGLFFRGVLCAVPVVILESMGDHIAGMFSYWTTLYLFLTYFVVPGLIEEGMKYRVLRKKVWQNINFNFRFDGVVYAVFVSLGFAAVENVLYVMDSGFGTAVVRALFSIPGHAMFGVVMGVYLGKARWLESNRQFQQSQAMRRRAVLVPLVLHGTYDFLLMAVNWAFYPYFFFLAFFVIRLLRRAAREDGPTGPAGPWGTGF